MTFQKPFYKQAPAFDNAMVLYGVYRISTTGWLKPAFFTQVGRDGLLIKTDKCNTHCR
jgi:hypothetical protein